MGIHNDEALLRLPENFRQAHRGEHIAAKAIAEGEARAHGGQRIRVTHQNQPLIAGDGPEQAVEQLDVHHGHLLHDHRVRL